MFLSYHYSFLERPASCIYFQGYSHYIICLLYLGKCGIWNAVNILSQVLRAWTTANDSQDSLPGLDMPRQQAGLVTVTFRGRFDGTTDWHVTVPLRLCTPSHQCLLQALPRAVGTQCWNPERGRIAKPYHPAPQSSNYLCLKGELWKKTPNCFPITNAYLWC